MKESAKDSLRITNQFRAKDAMVYDLRCEGTRLTVSVSQRRNEQDPAEWCVAARSGAAPNDVTVEEWGPSAAKALEKIATSWGTRRESEAIPSFDWTAVAAALAAVRAI